MLTSETLATVAEPAGLFRRFGAMLYDSLLLTGLWMMTLLLIRPLFDSETIPPNWVQPIVLSETVGYFLYSWLKSGQTLGMRAWRLKVVDEQGMPVTVRSCLLRLLVAPLSLIVFGLGYLWVLGKDRRTWHDLASGGYIVQLPEADTAK